MTGTHYFFRPQLIYFFIFALTTLPVSLKAEVPKTPPMSSVEKAFHLLNRMGYGPRPGEAESLAQKKDPGIEAWINEQLHPEKISDTEVDNKLKNLTTLSMTIAQLHEAYPRPERLLKSATKGKKSEAPTEEHALATFSKLPKKDRDQFPRHILIELISQKLVRAVESKRQFQEVLVDFWFNHFNVDFSKGQLKWYITPYERDVIRPRVFGKFRDLLGAVAKSPAMLFYLDNFQSVRDGLKRPQSLKGGDGVPKTLGLNENYGRELLELHTLGVDGGYTQKDVRETARALTGWSLEQPQRATEFKFRPRAHDEDSKHILNLILPAGGGIDDGEKVLDLLARRPETARFIAKKLAVKFISDRPPESAVQKLAGTFQKTDGDLRAVYTELFHLPEFWSAQARRSKIKTPWEFEVSAARAVGATIQVSEKPPQRTMASLEQMGEPLYRCQPPTGFKATSEYWVNPGSLVTRINYGLALAADRIPEINIDQGIFWRKLNQEHSEELEASIDHLNRWILGGEMRAETRTRLVKELGSEEKVVAEKDFQQGAFDLSKLLGLILGSPEFQRR
jgi:uncharacterized protein (DUF1800 family)